MARLSVHSLSEVLDKEKDKDLQEEYRSQEVDRVSFQHESPKNFKENHFNSKTSLSITIDDQE